MKENQKIIDANQPEQYALEKNGVYFLYANIKGINENKGNFFELFEIVDKEYIPGRSTMFASIFEDFNLPDFFSTVTPGQLPTDWLEPVNSLYNVVFPAFGLPIKAMLSIINPQFYQQ